MSLSPSQFLAVALSSANTSFALSYSDPDQRWVIRKHLLLLLQEYPSFSLSTESFTHDNGTTVWLLNAGGHLHVSGSAPRIHVMIWVHEDYPYVAPKVFVVSENPINKNHPFVKPCGSVVSTYVRTWEYPGSNLKDLVHNLVKLFSHHHPFFTIPGPKLSHPTLASRREAMDRLVGSLYSDVVAINDDAREELEQLGALQSEMVKRSDIATSMVISLEHEKLNLKKAVSDLATDADTLMNWLKVHHPKFGAPDSVNEMAEKAFEAADEVSGLVMEALAADGAVEDVIYALEKGLEESVLGPEVYVKQVRSLAREQFHHKEMLLRCSRQDNLV
uniref:Uncharacterized protein n=1 Tax=Kalanchoe fedtschenkoi TaxID=63787 RepID=A0A7N0ZZ10_KALFE